MIHLYVKSLFKEAAMMPEIMAEALNLAMYGMGTVFVFLTVLVGLTTLMSRFALYLDKLNPPAPELTRAKAQPVAQQSPALIAAVAAAVKQYRERH